LEAPDAASYDWGREFLKWVAIATMTVDHIGLVLYPEYTVLRFVGRLAFPLFAYLLVLGVESTRTLRGYFNRLLFFGLVSQIPFALANGVQPWEKLNIFFTLALGLTTVYLMEKNSPLIFIPLAASFLPVDFGIYGTATILFFYLLRKDWRVGTGLFALVNAVLYVIEPSYQPLALLALPLILLHSWGRLNFGGGGRAHPVFRKYFFYVYYPLHLLALVAIKKLA
jgi:hypothetical protein